MSILRCVNLPAITFGLIVFQVLISCNSVDAAITFNGAKCGTTNCRLDQFCSKYHKQCEECSTICDNTTHNFDKEMCTLECQDYLHDTRYGSRNSAGKQGYRESIQVIFELTMTSFFFNRRTLPPSKTIESSADPSSDRPRPARCQPWNSASQVVQGPRIRLGSIEKVETEEEIFSNNGKIREDGI